MIPVKFRFLKLTSPKKKSLAQRIAYLTTTGTSKSVIRYESKRAHFITFVLPGVKNYEF